LKRFLVFQEKLDEFPLLLRSDMFDYGKLVMVLQKKDHDLRELASGALMGDIRLKIRGPNLLI